MMNANHVGPGERPSPSLTAELSSVADEMEDAIRNHDPETALPRLDAANKQFLCSDGTIINLSDKKVTSLMIERVAAEGKPKVPMVEVTIGGKHKTVEYHPQDPGYQAKLKEWEEESQLRTMRYIFVQKVADNPPENFVSEHLEWFPTATGTELKYLWVASQIPDEDVELFVASAIGQNAPTQKGIEEVADSFRGESEWPTD